MNQIRTGKLDALMVLFRQGRLEELEREAVALLKAAPEEGLAWKLLGAALQLQRKPSLEAMRKAAALLPDDPEAYSNLAFSLKDYGLFSESEQACRRALLLRPGHVEALCNLAISLRHQSRLAEARGIYEQALQSHPGHLPLRCGYGVILKDLGEFEASFQQFRQALMLQLPGLKELVRQGREASRPATRAVPPLQRHHAHAALDAVFGRLKAAGIPWFMAAGTLLGIYRDGDVLPYDKDMDIGLPGDLDRNRLLTAFCSEGDFELVPQSAVPENERYRFSMTFRHCSSGVVMDALFFHRHGDGHFIHGLDHAGIPILACIHAFSLGELDWRGRQWPVPDRVETYLQELYGAGWSTPDPDFDTLISHPNRLKESMPPVICYGYSCLNTRLQEKNWIKARAYCRQLLTRVKDPLLEEMDLCVQGLENAALS